MPLTPPSQVSPRGPAAPRGSVTKLPSGQGHRLRLFGVGVEEWRIAGAGPAAELLPEPADLGFQHRLPVPVNPDHFALTGDHLRVAQLERQVGQLGPRPAMPVPVLRRDRLGEPRDAEQVTQHRIRAKAVLRCGEQQPEPPRA